ncbi:MAG: hypothetical protein LBL13_10355 [Bacteroidales bacterium]|jgi:transcriptional regulator with XRE-family HTH domain|nr:hypothetical protein [Bacteroidales bacterium]
MQKDNENNTKIIDRLLYIFDKQGGNFSQLATNIGLSNSYFSKMAKNRGSLGEDVIYKILLYYEKINPEWLLTGNGQMLKYTQPVKEEKEDEPIPAKQIFELLKQQLEEKDKQIAALTEVLKEKGAKNDITAPAVKQRRVAR